MSDSIENDVEFMKLVKTVEKLERQISAVCSYEMLLWNHKELSEIDDKRLHNLQCEASRARKAIYKYIDLYVERAVAQERKVQQVDKLKELYEKFDEDRNNEKLRVDRNGKCIFNFKELPLHLFDDLNRLLIQEILRIDPALLMIKDHSIGFEGVFYESLMELEERTIVVFFRFDGMRLELRFKSDNGLIEINLPEIAKYFSDEVNKIARGKYAPK